ncbi:DUF6573 family protein [Chondromyces crocatus]|uniref:DUF6573 family protein n=1 Tax=Chondromyces crocatus TaxID=52 RepID=UPI0012E324FE|nr:DUF6573 family protein [Chondromyces crocatus]
MYSRLEAIEDGELVEVTAHAKMVGFTLPVVLAENVWMRCVELTEAAEAAGLTEKSRLAELLSAAYAAIVREPDAMAVWLHLYVVSDSPDAERTELKLIYEPGDNGEPEITIMFAEED